MKMVWAYHSEDPVPGLPLAYHGPGQRGARSAFLVLRVDQSAPSREKVLHTWELRNPSVSYCRRSIPRICQMCAARHVYLAPKLPPTAHTHRRGPLARGPHPFRCFVPAPSRAQTDLLISRHAILQNAFTLAAILGLQIYFCVSFSPYWNKICLCRLNSPVSSLYSSFH